MTARVGVHDLRRAILGDDCPGFREHCSRRRKFLGERLADQGRKGCDVGAIVPEKGVSSGMVSGRSLSLRTERFKKKIVKLVKEADFNSAIINGKKAPDVSFGKPSERRGNGFFWCVKRICL